MAENSKNIAQWPCLGNGLHYNWIVDYVAFSAFGTYELSSEEWENRDLIVNFKGNSELTTEIDHQKAVDKAIELAVGYLREVFPDTAADGDNSLPSLKQLTLVCIPASRKKNTERRFRRFSDEVCKLTGMENAYDAFSYTTTVDEDGDEVDTLHIDEAFLKGKQVLLFDDIVASGGSLQKFADRMQEMGVQLVGAVVLGKKI